MKNYFIGLDMGTDSIGWAVTDLEYNLLKDHGTDYWGSYLFDSAQTAVERRGFRAARRRTKRMHHRLMLLQELFKEEIAKVDPLFFIRLNNSNLLEEDKEYSVSSRNYLFDEKMFNDKEFFRKYPTIFHLRKTCLQGDITDIRLLYLAIHHIIKNRGHFLFEGQNFSVGDIENVKENFRHINNILFELYGEETDEFVTLPLEQTEEVLRVLENDKIVKKEKEHKIKELFSIDKKNKQKGALISAICGSKFNVQELLRTENDLGDFNRIVFDESFDDSKLEQLGSVMDEEEADLIRNAKAIYDWSVLSNILQGEQYISVAKVKLFDEHNKDLRLLKDYIKENCPKKYVLTFRKKENVNNYASYIGMDKKHRVKRCKKETFYDFLRNEIGIKAGIIAEKIENGTFMPKQRTSSNGLIPYQVHLAELKTILSKAEKQFPFLWEERDGYTVAEKIIALMTFKIPYYVGPLTTRQGKFSWMKKQNGVTENTPITPWNFDKVVDKDASEQAFIRRMTNKCTYLLGEDVLPESSLLYSRFAFLNELNNLKVYGEKNKKVKELIYEYAKENKKVTLKKCLTLLQREGIVEKTEKVEDVFSGIDVEFKCSLSSYSDFKKIIGDKVDAHSEMVEQIIFWITVISDKNRVQTLIKKHYGHILSETEIKAIKSLNYTKWGRLSQRLLKEIKSANCVDENGEILSIIQAMETKTENFMELLSDRYFYKESIDEYNSELQGEDGVNYKTVKNLYCSPVVKRTIWRAVCLVKEIVKVQGNAPKKIFIEMARETKDNGKKGQRTTSRKQMIIDLYKSIGAEGKEWIKEIENTPDREFNSDKLYFYYTQMGRDMYTGKPIPLDAVFNTTVYDIDHIYPRSKIKDDSLSNRILVNKEDNQRLKGDDYPIPNAISQRQEVQALWRTLKEKKFISEEKYYRLTRKTALTPDELADFINRQLIETQQSTKEAAQILKRLLPDTEVVYSKAKNAGDFKQNILKLTKVRELNDLHHAKDAYVNIVIGNIYNEKFNHNARIFFQKNGIEKYNMNNLYWEKIDGVWDKSYISRVKKIADKNSCRVVRFTEEGHGGLYNATIKTKGANDGLIPLKEIGPRSDTKKYGGYDSTATAYFMLVQSDGKKGARVCSIERMTLYGEKRYSNKTKEEYCADCLGLKNPKVVVDKIKINTLLNINGSYAYIRGVSSGGAQIVLCNANQLVLDEDNTQYLKWISNAFRDKKKNKSKELPLSDKITSEKNLILYQALTEKLASKIYGGLNISGQAQMLKEKQDVFASLELEKQVEVLWEVLHFMQCNSDKANLKSIGGDGRMGTVSIGKNLAKKKYPVFKMIEQSPTGHYRKITDLTVFL